MPKKTIPINYDMISEVDMGLPMYVYLVCENINSIYKKKNKRICKLFKKYRKLIVALYLRAFVRKCRRALGRMERARISIPFNFEYSVMYDVQTHKKITMLFLRIMVTYILLFHKIYKKQRNLNNSKYYTYTQAMRGVVDNVFDVMDECIFCMPNLLLKLFVCFRNSGLHIKKEWVVFATSRKKISMNWLYTKKKYHCAGLLSFSKYYCCNSRTPVAISLINTERKKLLAKFQKKLYITNISWIRSAMNHNKYKKSKYA